MMNFKSLVVASATLSFFQGAVAGVTRRWGTPAGPSCTDFTPFTYAGCFSDPAGTGGARALPFVSDLSTNNMTPDTCVSFCKGNGYRYAGIEYYGECYCGASVQGPQIDESNCDFPCSGNASDACGGNYILSVYQDPTFPVVDNTVVSDYQFAGCYSEGTSGRSLVYRQNQVDSTTMTIESCLGACKLGGYPLAGVEYGGECYCGVVLGNGTASTALTDCNMACNGNAAETCGGPSRLDLYVAVDLESQQPCVDLNYPTPSTSSSAAPSTSSSSSSSLSSTSTSCTTTSTSSSTSSSTSTSANSSSSSSSSSTSTSWTTTTTSATTTSSAPPQCTTTLPPTCEYKCGSWCSTPLSPFTGSSDCKTAASNCLLQVAGCFLNNPFPDSLKCFDFAGWCNNVSSYCSSSPCASGKCSNNDCKSKYPPPSNPSSPPSVSVYPCPVTTGKPTSTPKPSSTTTSCTSVPVPTPSNICKQPNNPSKGYSSDSPCGGIPLPCLTCNNLKSDYDSGNCFKLYHNKDSSSCPSYKKSSVGQGCQAACKTQYDSCVGTYAQGCKQSGGNYYGGSSSYGNGGGNGGSGGYGGNNNRYREKRDGGGGGGDSYQTAMNKCQNQYNDCLSVNAQVNVGSRCGSWNAGWS